MTIQGSINIALSSLNLLQQQSSMISTNMANASTAGYAQRDVIGGEFRSGGFGSGVVATEVRALANQTAAQAILTALERLQKHGHTGTVVYTNLKAAVPRPDHRTYSGAEGFQALVDRIHLASVESGCEVAWCSSGHPRMGAARAVARDEREEASL